MTRFRVEIQREKTARCAKSEIQPTRYAFSDFLESKPPPASISPGNDEEI
jgi:hypothetical protein